MSVPKLRLETSIESRFEHIGFLSELARGIMVEDGYCEDSAQSVAVCVSEAGTNAIKWGNRCNPEKPVTFSLELYDNRVEMDVTDCGTETFDYNAFLKREKSATATRRKGYIDRQLGKEKAEVQNGMGMFLLSSLLTSFSYSGADDNKKGTRLHMVYERKSQDSTSSQ